jgi:hypothetical protein
VFGREALVLRFVGAPADLFFFFVPMSVNHSTA